MPRRAEASSGAEEESGGCQSPEAPLLPGLQLPRKDGAPAGPPPPSCTDSTAPAVAAAAEREQAAVAGERAPSSTWSRLWGRLKARRSRVSAASAKASSSWEAAQMEAGTLQREHRARTGENHPKHEREKESASPRSPPSERFRARRGSVLAFTAQAAFRRTKRSSTSSPIASRAAHVTSSGKLFGHIHKVRSPL